MNKIKKAVDEYNQRINKTNIILEEDGSVTTRWEKYGVQLRIAQAACNYGGYIVTGTRHYCPIMSLQIDAIGHDKLKEFAGGLDNVQQGFTTQYGESLLIVKKATKLHWPAANYYHATNMAKLFIAKATCEELWTLKLKLVLKSHPIQIIAMTILSRFTKKATTA